MLVWLSNLKKAATGTLVGTSECLDVRPQNTAGTPIYVSGVGAASGRVLETRFHDTSSTTINASGGTWVQIGGATALANTITKMKVSCTFGEPIGIRKAATAGAAAALADDNALLNQGQSADFEVSFASGDKLWALSKSSNSISSGYLTLNLVG